MGFGQGCNSPVSLVPKAKDPLTIFDYQPICLIGYFYKIVAKLLAKLLKLVVDGLV